jgi:hypothetical protein
MPVYTNGVHLVADSEEELHAFASLIGLKREWFQNTGRAASHPHYDTIYSSKKKLAIKHGAIKIRPREILEKAKLLSKPIQPDEE